MSYEEFEKEMIAANKKGIVLTGHIVFAQSSFSKEYPQESRTYVVSSDNKRWCLGAISNSVWGSCLDGSDSNVKLSDYMFGPNAWEIENCYIVNTQA